MKRAVPVMLLASLEANPVTCNLGKQKFGSRDESLSANDVDVEMRRSQHPPQSHPKREKHFRATRVGDVTEINNVAGLPAKPFTEPVGDFAFGRRVVAADEQIVIARQTRGSDHDVAVHRVKRLHDAHIGKFTLSLFSTAAWNVAPTAGDEEISSILVTEQGCAESG
jgi:hypothetical protein